MATGRDERTMLHPGSRNVQRVLPANLKAENTKDGKTAAEEPLPTTRAVLLLSESITSTC
ncbi:hypothetical protein DBV39_05175 [Orrella marina]|uniref:Uncharacterized protein n=1 Tax=Orrella marina TaxID=2163011 RepID=A0A2R4XHG0_9BURK|nr:hypothetical protein DBV39_05175 [Orrella marina]